MNVRGKKWLKKEGKRKNGKMKENYAERASQKDTRGKMREERKWDENGAIIKKIGER